MNRLNKLSLILILSSVATNISAQPTASDYAATPAFVTDSSDPVVVINLSVELTQQAEAFTGAQQTYAGGTDCPGRLNGESVCYTKDEKYIGYFDPEKCYVYQTAGTNVSPVNYSTANIFQDADTDLTSPSVTNRSDEYFKPTRTVTDRSCSSSNNEFSGNFMNWASMTALDQFRAAMVGGARLVDTVGPNAQTLLTRTHRISWPFVTKRISSTPLSGFDTAPSTVTPFSGETTLVIRNNSANQIRFEKPNGDLLGEFSVIVEVCNSSVGIEENCVEYSDDTGTISGVWHKPEGVMQRNASNMRFALLTYTGENTNERNGGVLRSNAKYIGYLAPQEDGGLDVNPYAETNRLGQHVFDANCIAENK